MTEADLRDLICLTMVRGVGPLASRALLERFVTAGRALDASPSALRAVPGVGPKLAEKIARARRDH
ncbi:MAG: DNA-protecting protein DprA, partial [Planctomycetaceae bacterium]|nr:DNA-protecting protein DprA [Planctomycetaceae bacterium]